jgi:cell division protein FtsI/penicillin-binding protein 2
MKFLDTRIGKGIIALCLGVFLIIMRGDFISTKTVGYVIAIFSILYIVGIFFTNFQIKKSKKHKEIENPKHSMIAYYLERHKIKYIYLPKDEKELTFSLPEYDVYIKYWEKEPYNKEERKKILKKLEGRDTHLVELFHDNLSSIQKLDWKFTERLLELLKKK